MTKKLVREAVTVCGMAPKKAPPTVVSESTMDPDWTLNRLRGIISRILEKVDKATDLEVDVAEHFLALDEWLKKGGFLPKDWRKPN
jgi:hypothetical protein